MLAVGVCDLPETGGSIFVLVAGLFLLVAGVTLTRWVRQSAGRLSIVVAPLVLIGGLTLVPSAADGCYNPSTDAPSLAVVGSLPAPSTPLLSNAALGGAGLKAVAEILDPRAEDVELRRTPIVWEIRKTTNTQQCQTS